MDRENYYNILKVDKNASDSDIKKAYRKLALELHPDMNTAKDAEEKFKEISEAYAVLSNSEKRRLYDRTGNIDFFNMFNMNAASKGMSHRPFCRRKGMGRKCGMDRFNPQRFRALKKGNI